MRGSYIVAVRVGGGFSRQGGLAAMVMAAGREVGDEGTPHPFSVCTTKIRNTVNIYSNLS